MRRRIQQLAREKFERVRPFLSLSADRIEIELSEGKDYTGDFVITSVNHVPMRGMVYSSNPRMECLTPQFEGEEVRIRYQFHSYGLVEGDIQKGEFCIAVNQGEYNLSFVVSVSGLYADSSIGKIKNLNDFAKLAAESFEEAYRLFYSGHFRHILPEGGIREQLLYEGLRQGEPLGQKVEEFLTAIGKKPKTVLTLAGESAEFSGVESSRKETLTLHRNQGGYLEIRVSSDAAFLTPERRRLTDEDFVGSVLSLDYYIDSEKLHAGKNYGRLCLEIPGETLYFSVCVSGKARRGREEKARHREVREARAKLMELYLNYRLKRIVTGVWANRSIELLERLGALCPGEPLYGLMKAQALIMNRQRQEASWILEDFKREYKERTTPVYGYYLYLCTLMEREPSYVDKVTEEIEQIFRRHPDSSLLFWILLFVREEYYRDGAKRFRAIEQWMTESRSPYFYLEAYYLIWQEPSLLTRLDGFSAAVLHWAVKWNALTKDVALQAAELITEKKEFSRRFYRIAEACCEAAPGEETLSAICGYLIKNQRFDTEYHKWYALGVEQEIRITGLYEAYLMSLDGGTLHEVPKVIQMYFQYENRLPYRQKAALFVNIIAAKDRQPEVYQKYRRMIEQFFMEQLEAGHIDDNLAVIYDEMLGEGVLNEELAHSLAGVLFTHKLTCMEPWAAKLYVLERQRKKVQEYPIQNGTAYFMVDTNDYCLILEDCHGNRFCGSQSCHDEALFNPELYINSCLKLAGDELSYLLYALRGKVSAEDFSDEDFRYAAGVLRSDEVSGTYKAQLGDAVLRSCRKKRVEAAYLAGFDAGILDKRAKRFLMDYLAEQHLYEDAFRMAEECGYDYMESRTAAALCSYAVTEHGFEEDDFLLGFAETVFRKGKYNDVVLIYLCKYYNGATKTMAKLWQAAGAFELDTYDLEERVLTHMLYTTEYVPDISRIFDSYAAGGGEEELCLAYLSYFADAFLEKDMVVPGEVFSCIQDRYLAGGELNDACRIGLLKYLSGQQRLEQKQYEAADRLLERYTAQNIYFTFYGAFDKRLRRKYHLYDRFFVEYHAKPGSRVLIRYSMDGIRYREERMTEAYDGIFIREFILFFGETVQYYVIEEKDGAECITESAELANQNMEGAAGLGSYGRLNEMLVAKALGEQEALAEKMKDYDRVKRIAGQVFRLL